MKRRFRRPRSGIVAYSLAPRCIGCGGRAAASVRVREPGARRGRDRQPRGEPLDAGDEALAHQFEHEAVGCGENQRVGACTGFRRKRPDPVLNCCAGSSCSSRRRQASQRFCILWLAEVSWNFTFFGMSYPQPRARSAGKRDDLTMHWRARSNTPFFQAGQR